MNNFELKKFSHLDYPNIDFNDLKKLGVYYFPQNGLNRCKNSPAFDQGVLLVFAPYYTYQKYLTGIFEFKRYYNYDLKIWSEWKKVI